MTLDELREELARELSVELEPVAEGPEKGSFEITFDGWLLVRIFINELGRVTYEGSLGPVPVGEFEAEQLLKRTLQYNLARMQHQNDVLARDPESGNLVIFRTFPPDTTTWQEARLELEQFLNQYEFWKKTIAERPASGRDRFAMLMP